VQVVPHITNAVKAAFTGLENAETDVVMVELGGTVGDIEGLPYIEAFRQFRLERPAGEMMFIHLTLVPHLRTSNEIKTKPTQHSVQKLREYGIQPDMLICRSEEPVPAEPLAKMALFCNVRPGYVIDEPNVETSIYEVPVILHRQGVDEKICRFLGLRAPEPDLAAWESMLDSIRNPLRETRVAVVGAYHGGGDGYKSLCEALAHAGARRRTRVHVTRVDARGLEAGGQEAREALAGASAVIVPGGHAYAGAEGMLEAIRHARENRVPYLGLGYGLQCAVVEFARHVCGAAEASSTEWFSALGWGPERLDAAWVAALDEDRRPCLPPGPGRPPARKGLHAVKIDPRSRAHAIYGDDGVVLERHRNACEVAPDKIPVLVRHGMAVTGVNPESRLAELVELPDHPFFVAAMFRPEFLSRPTAPHPLFLALVDAAVEADRAKRGEDRPGGDR